MDGHGLTGAEVGLFAAALVAVLGAFFAGVVQVINAIKQTQRDVVDTASALAKKTETTNVEMNRRLSEQDHALGEIKVQTNGGVELLHKEIAMLKTHIQAITGNTKGDAQ